VFQSARARLEPVFQINAITPSPSFESANRFKELIHSAERCPENDSPADDQGSATLGARYIVCETSSIGKCLSCLAPHLETFR